MATNKKHIKKIMVTLSWSLLAVLCVWLLVAAIGRQDAAVCKKVIINVYGNGSNLFIDKKDVMQIINSQNNGQAVGQKISSLHLSRMEAELRKNDWVHQVQLYIDNHKNLRVEIEESVPVARIFTSSQKSFYVDSGLAVLPLSDKFSARLPVFTNFPAEVNGFRKSDSALLKQMVVLANIINHDEYLMAMIAQIDMNPSGQFEMIPKIGRQVILFGNADEAKQKFDKLKIFYRTVIKKLGWQKYSTINLQFKDQVVAVIRDREEIKADSLRALALLEEIAKNAAAEAANANTQIVAEPKGQEPDRSIIQQSIERDEEPETQSATATEIQTVLPAAEVKEPVVNTSAKKIAAPKPVAPKITPKTTPKIKPKPKPPASTPKRVPKAVMDK